MVNIDPADQKTMIPVVNTPTFTLAPPPASICRLQVFISGSGLRVPLSSATGLTSRRLLSQSHRWAGLPCTATCVVFFYCRCSIRSCSESASETNMNHTNMAPELVPRSGHSKALPPLMSLKRGIFNHIDWMSS